MFEDLFIDRDAIAGYRAAPLLRERLSYLRHCAREGARPLTLRRIAATQLTLIRFLDLREGERVSVPRVEAAAAPVASTAPSCSASPPASGSGTARPSSSAAPRDRESRISPAPSATRPAASASPPATTASPASSTNSPSPGGTGRIPS